MTYRVVLSGTVAPGTDLHEARLKLMAATGQTEAVAVKLLSGGPTTIKRNLPRDDAERIVAVLSDMGALASLEEEAPGFTIDEAALSAIEESATGSQASPPAAEVADSDADARARIPDRDKRRASPAIPAYLAERGIAASPSHVQSAGQLGDEAMYRAIIGPRNTDFYLHYFAKRDAGGSFLSWNWPCAVFQFWWALYRKCYGFALGGLLLTIVFGAIAGAIYGAVAGAAGASTATIETYSQFFGYFGGWLVGAFGNGFYHRKARRLIRDTANVADPSLRLGALARRGGTTAVWFWILLLVVVAGIVAAIAVPAYQDYVGRSRGTMTYQQGASGIPAEVAWSILGRANVASRDIGGASASG